MKYSFDYEDYDQGLGAGDLLKTILEDKEFQGQTELVIGNWGSILDEGFRRLKNYLLEI